MSDQCDPAKKLSSDDISQFLIENKRFFIDHPEVLAAVELHHRSGKAVSLIEKQVQTLRNNNQALQSKLDELIQNARHNDNLLAKTQRLTLSLIEAHDIGDVLDALYYSFDKDFEIDFIKILLTQHQQASTQASLTTNEDLKSCFGDRLTSHNVVSNALTHEENLFLFGEEAAKEVGSGSAALLIAGSKILGLIAIASRDKTRYDRTSGTLFLKTIADLFSATLNQHYIRKKKT